MIKYGDLVGYIKRNHINWNTDLFDVLKGFFDEYLPQPRPTLPTFKNTSAVESSSQRKIIFERKSFSPPEGTEYTEDDLLNLFST